MQNDALIPWALLRCGSKVARFQGERKRLAGLDVPNQQSVLGASLLRRCGRRTLCCPRLLNHVVHSVDHNFGVVDLNVMAAVFRDDLCASRGKVRQLFLHFFPGIVRGLRQVWRKFG
jgi:hypothetical protein